MEDLLARLEKQRLEELQSIRDRLNALGIDTSRTTDEQLRNNVAPTSLGAGLGGKSVLESLEAEAADPTETLIGSGTTEDPFRVADFSNTVNALYRGATGRREFLDKK